MPNDKKPSLIKTFTAGLWDNNPVLRLLLGMCPTLAVTAAVKPALTMGLSVIFVLVFSNAVVSLLRHQLKPHVRILMFTLTIATAVTIADLALKAFLPDMSTAPSWRRSWPFPCPGRREAAAPRTRRRSSAESAPRNGRCRMPPGPRGSPPLWRYGWGEGKTTRSERPRGPET